MKTEGRKPRKFTLAELRGVEGIPEEDREEMGRLAVRLIQIQDEVERLNRERGFTDYRGDRQPGLADQLEELYIRYDIDGVRVENYQVLPAHGSHPRIDRVLLLGEGVQPEQIQAATITTYWSGVQVRRDRERGGDANDG